MARLVEKNNNKYRNILFVVFILICAFIISINNSCTFQKPSDESWPMFKFNVERTGANNSYEFNSIKLLWKYEYEINEKGGDSRISPAVSSNKVAVSTRTYISCFNSDNGELIWKKYIGENYSSPVIYNNNVVISSVNSINAFDIEDGAVTWNKNLAKEKEDVTAGISVPAGFKDKLITVFVERMRTKVIYYASML